MKYEIEPVTIIITEDGEIKTTPCTDEQAMEWNIYATDHRDGERKCILHAMSAELAAMIVDILEHVNYVKDFEVRE
jgi:hypothetical protein